MSRNGLRSLRWERGENRIQAIGRAMNHAPRSDGGEIEILKPLNSEHISGVIEILSPPPAELLHNKILRLRNPCRPPQTRQNEPPSSTELMLHKRIVEEREEFDEESRIDPCRSDMPAAPRFVHEPGGAAPTACEPPASQLPDRLHSTRPQLPHACERGRYW